MRGQHREVFARAVQGAAIFRAVEAELDGVDPRGAERKGGAADHHADQDAGDETPLQDDDDDREQRQIFGERQPPARLHDPAVQRVGAEIEQQAAQHEFRHVAEQDRRKQQHRGGDRGRGQARKAAAAAGVVIQHGAADRDATGVAAEHARQHVGEACGVQLALEIGFAIGSDFDAGGVEQRARRGDEYDRDDVAGDLRQRIPGIMLDLVRAPRQHRRDVRRRLEDPAERLRLCRRNSGEMERDMRGERAADQDHGQAERRAGAVPGEVKHQRHRAGRREFVSRLHVLEMVEGRKLQLDSGDDPDRAEQDQAAGGAEEAADHGVGHVADGAAHPRQAKAAEHEAGREAGDAEGDQHWPEDRRRRIVCSHVLDQRGRQNAGHRRGRGFRSADRERERTSQRQHGGEDRRGDEGGRNAVGKVGRQRSGEDQQRIGQAEGGRQHARGRAAEDVVEGALKWRVG